MEQLTLKAIRTNLGLSAKEMGEIVGLSETQWRRRENYEIEMGCIALTKLLDYTKLDYSQIKLK